MKKLFLLVMLLGMQVAIGYAQEARQQKDPDDTLAPYQKNPTLPAFNLLEMDSVTIFNTYNIPKGRTVALVLFSPDCSHCKRMTKEIISKMDSLKDIDFYMCTLVHNMTETRKFYAEHHLADYSNIKLTGRDYEFFFGSFYKIRVVPDIALYDKDKKLIKLLQGEVPVHAIYEAAHSSPE